MSTIRLAPLQGQGACKIVRIVVRSERDLLALGGDYVVMRLYLWLGTTFPYASMDTAAVSARTSPLTLCRQ